MINKREFLKSGATAIVASAGAGATATLAAVRPTLGESSGVAGWLAHVGQAFEVDGHAVTLQAVSILDGRQPGEQFSLSFAGPLPNSMNNGLHQLSLDSGESLCLYLVRTPLGLRADFSRLQG